MGRCACYQVQTPEEQLLDEGCFETLTRPSRPSGDSESSTQPSPSPWSKLIPPPHWFQRMELTPIVFDDLWGRCQLCHCPFSVPTIVRGQEATALVERDFPTLCSALTSYPPCLGFCLIASSELSCSCFAGTGPCCGLDCVPLTAIVMSEPHVPVIVTL